MVEPWGAGAGLSSPWMVRVGFGRDAQRVAPNIQKGGDLTWLGEKGHKWG